MSAFRRSFLFLASVLLLASCAEPEKPKTPVRTANAPAGSRFDEIGKVSLYVGESCASQIMFVFHSERSTSISLAAPMRETKILTGAAHDHCSVRVLGKWRRGEAAGCYYVEATQVEAQKSFW
jgi:hypothetical protein